MLKTSRALADGAVAIQVKGLELELPRHLGGRRVQDGLLQHGHRLLLSALPTLRIEVVVLEIPAKEEL